VNLRGKAFVPVTAVAVAAGLVAGSTVVIADSAGAVVPNGAVVPSGAGAASGSFTPAPRATKALTSATVGVKYSKTLSAKGFTSKKAKSKRVSGKLPSGLKLGSTTHKLAGTPKAYGTFSFIVKFSKKGKKSKQRSYSLKVKPAPLRIVTESFPDATRLASYRGSLAATGGTGGYFWTKVSGDLPPTPVLPPVFGLGGTLSMRPSAAGISKLTVRVTDSSGRSTTRLVSVKVNATPEINTPTTPTGHVGSPYSYQFANTGGSSPFTWSVTTGTLPTGLTLSSSGKVTGTPTTVQTKDFRVSVTDRWGATATQLANSSIEVQAPQCALGSGWAVRDC